MNYEQLFKRAKRIVELCICNKKGFSASARNYGGQLWLRDLFYSMEGLILLGYEQIVRRQLLLTLRSLGKNGEVPSFVYGVNLITHLKYGMPALISRIFDRQFHPWVSDNPMLLIISFWKYSKLTGNSEFFNAFAKKWGNLVLRYIQSKIDPQMGLIQGADYRDCLLFDKALLTNQADLYFAYKILGKSEFAERVCCSINELFWNQKGYYTDYPMGSKFDTLGNVKVLEYELVPKTRIEKVINSFKNATTKFGFLNLNPPYTREELMRSWRNFLSKKKVNVFLRYLFTTGVERNAQRDYQNSVIVPFVHNLAVIALAKSGYEDFARVEFEKTKHFIDFHEYYNPVTGESGGSPLQLWSAATWIYAYKTLKGMGII